MGDGSRLKNLFMHPDRKIWRYDVYSDRKAKHYDWAIVFIDEAGVFLTFSDYGNFGYCWSCTGYDDPRKFFLDPLRDVDYFAKKFAQGQREFDENASIKNIKEHIKYSRRNNYLNKDEAREEWDRISLLDDGPDIWHSETKICDAYELLHYRTPVGCTAFVERIMPRLAKLIEKDLENGQL